MSRKNVRGRAVAAGATTVLFAALALGCALPAQADSDDDVTPSAEPNAQLLVDPSTLTLHPSADGTALDKARLIDTRDDGLDEYYSDLAKELFDPDGDGTYEIGDPPAGGESAGNVPDGLEAYYSQQVDLTSENCLGLGFSDLFMDTYEGYLGRDIECGYVITAADSTNPDAGNLAIAVMRVKAASGESKGSVLWNPGGPGGSGLTFAVAGALYEPDLAEDYDMIGFDPRGTGDSMPFSQCSSDEQLDADRASTALSQEQSVAEDLLNADSERYADDCFGNTGKAFGFDADGRADLVAHMGTWNAVDDIDVLRSVLGDEQLNYIGFSYGTRLGYVYAQKYQENAGKLVLDGVVDPGDVAASVNTLDDEIDPGDQDVINQGAGFQDTFEQFALDCSSLGDSGDSWEEAYPYLFEEGGSLEGADDLAASDFACPLGDGITDTDELTAANATLLQSLLSENDGQGLPTGFDDRYVTFSDGRTGIIEALYSESYWGELAYGLSELAGGETAGMLMLLADAYNERDANGHYDPMLQAFTVIRCTDENASQNPPSDDYLRLISEKYDEAAPFQASGIAVGVHDYCDFWPSAGTLPGPEELNDVPNILVVSTSHDPATPYASGPKLVKIIDGTLLSVSGASHTSYMGDSVCTDDTVNTFFTEGTLPEDGDFGDPVDDTATDDEGNTVTFTTECKIASFRESTFTTSTESAAVGDSVNVDVTHEASLADYSIGLAAGSDVTLTPDEEAEISDIIGFTTSNGGNHSGELIIPGITPAGAYTVNLVDADGEVVASRPLEVTAAEVTPTPTATPTETATATPTASATATPTPAEGPLSPTGGDEFATVLVGGLGVALLGGITLLIVALRRRTS
ncbi:MAG: alpha/beta hydrolase [Microbacterium sp.]